VFYAFGKSGKPYHRLGFHTAWVNRAGLKGCGPLPIHPDEPTSPDRPGSSRSCHCTKSLRSSPLRGGKSREAGSQLRGQHWRV